MTDLSRDVFFVPNGTRLVDCGEMLAWIANQLHPQVDAEPTLLNLSKRELLGTDENGKNHWREDPLEEADWIVLGKAWGGLPPVANATQSAWGRYRDALLSWQARNPGVVDWELSASFKDHRASAQNARTNALNKHHHLLDSKLKSGQLLALNPDRTPAATLNGPGVMLPIEQAREHMTSIGFELKVSAVAAAGAMAALYVDEKQALWPIEKIPELVAEARHPQPEKREPDSVSFIKYVRQDGARLETCLTKDDKEAIDRERKRQGLPVFTHISSSPTWGAFLDNFNANHAERGWELGVLVSAQIPDGAFARAVDSMSYGQTLAEMVARGGLVQRLSNGAPLPPSPKVQGACLSRADLEKFCSSVLVEVRNKPPRPHFVIPVRPTEVPPSLVVLNPSSEVSYEEARKPGMALKCTGTADSLVLMFRDVIDRQSLGRFTLPEAAMIIAQAHDIDANVLYNKMIEAAREVDDAKRIRLYCGHTKLLRGAGEHVRAYIDYITVVDLNAWFKTCGDGLAFPSFPPVGGPVAPEAGSVQSQADSEDEDPRRRLKLFRKLGGKASRKGGSWKFTGIKDLVKAEEDSGRARRSEKTIREDLRKAADAEAEEKRAGLLVRQLAGSDSR